MNSSTSTRTNTYGQLGQHKTTAQLPGCGEWMNAACAVVVSFDPSCNSARLPTTCHNKTGDPAGRFAIAEWFFLFWEHQLGTCLHRPVSIASCLLRYHQQNQLVWSSSRAYRVGFVLLLYTYSWSMIYIWGKQKFHPTSITYGTDE
jgi:hypothetical protein